MKQKRASDHHDAGDLLALALAEAMRGGEEGGVPIGAVLVAADGSLLGAGCNGSVQLGDHLMHAETAAVRAAGRLDDYSGTTLVTTMTPCWYCAGLVRFLGIGAVVVGDTETWSDEALEWLESSGVSVTRLDDTACVDLFTAWLATDPPVWSSLPVSAGGRKAGR
jgi:cytosine/creatinine deaminase